MACLSKEQTEYIRRELERRNVSRSFLFEEWFDHVCCDVESLMHKGLGFREAFDKVAGQKGEEEVRRAHDLVQEFLNHPYVGIKKLLLLAFLVFAASWVINLEGIGVWVGLASFLILGTVYLRISVDFFRKRKLKALNGFFSILSILGFLGTVSGYALIFLNRNYGISTRGHGVDLTVFGWFLFSILCFLYYTGEYRNTIEKKSSRKNAWFITLSAFNVFLAGISIASFPLYHQVQAYLFYLIGFILGFNLVAILLMLLSRSMKHTLALSLVIGSFMIVFIHSPFRSRLPGGKPRLHQVTLHYSPEGQDIKGKYFISMYFDRFPDKPITLPMIPTSASEYVITMPSYSYRGWLYYSILRDSVDAASFFSRKADPDSLRLNIPTRKDYQLIPNP